MLFRSIARRLGGGTVVVKAQIHAGGRGKGGGVKVVTGPSEARAATAAMLGMRLVTHQTGPEGKTVKHIYVEQGSGIARELYLSCLVDRASSRVAFICSTEGGMDIETVAAETPEKILTLTIDPTTGFMPHHGRSIAFALGLSGDQVKQCVRLIGNLYRAMLAKDMSLLEINPLVLSQESFVALDVKVQSGHSPRQPPPRRTGRATSPGGRARCSGRRRGCRPCRRPRRGPPRPR